MYDNPAGLIAGAVIMELVAGLAVGLRFFSKMRDRQSSLITSDWLVLAGFVFGTGLTVIEVYGVEEHALGYPIGATLADAQSVTGQLNKAKHIQLAFILIGVVALGLIKLSVCFFYWHLFAKVTLRRFLIFWMVIIVVWATAFVMAGLLECGTHLLALFGTPTEYLQSCGSAVPSGYAMVGSDIATDFITLIIPIPIILRLHMDMHRKLLTLLAFSIGALSVAASCVKSYIYIRSSLGIYKEDGLIILTGLSIWNLAEVQIGIVAACGPLLWPVLARAFSPLTSFFSSRWSSKSKFSNHKEADELPHFVKMPESVEHLKGGARSVSVGASERTRATDHYEMDQRSDVTRPGVSV